jgi:DNA-binding IscR family transcriptional regulator
MLAPDRLLNRYERQLIYLAICKTCIDDYTREKSVTSEEVAVALKLPVRLATELIDELVSAGILLKADGGVIPRKNTETLSIGDILTLIDGENRMLTSQNIKTFEGILQNFRKGNFTERALLLRDV